ncbi:MAG: hypothetical protein NTV39_00800 [Candidatus Saccharibacteria bacterium]|nr:hypothetical protein [Candidatus Saccharibacteria bacterium]
MRYVNNISYGNLRFAKLFLTILIIAISFLITGQPASAATVSKQKGLTLSPLRTEMNIAPGTAQNGELKVTNNSTKPMVVTMSSEAFSVINQQYDYAFTAESNEVNWVSFNHPEVDLGPEESEIVTYTVGVPLSAEPGGRYLSVFASTDSGLISNGVESRQRVASLFYITVLGDVSRVGHLVSLSSPWFITGDSTWNTSLQNTGSTHYRSRYSLQIKDLIIDRTVASMSGESLVLPDTIRLIPNKLPAPFWPGVYKAVYNIGLGDNPAVTKTQLILYMPVWATIIVVIAVTIIASWLINKYKKT